MSRNPNYVSPLTGNPFAYLTAGAPKLTPILPSCRTQLPWTRERANDAKTRARKFLDSRWHRLVVEGETHTAWKGVQTREQIWEASRRLHAARTGDEVQEVISFISSGT
jgi:hypothetical protein